MKEKFSKINTANDVRELLLFSELKCDDPQSVKKRIMAGFEVKLIKSNAKRKVYLLRCRDGSEIYLKLFASQIFPFNVFRFYAKKEYTAARKLEQPGLPVIHYIAWGELQYGGFCLSEGIPEAESVRQYFYETLVHDPDPRHICQFTGKLSGLIRRMKQAKIHHPDFHLGNILYSRRTGNLYLADPWGIRENIFSSPYDILLLSHPWVELYGSIPMDLLIDGILSSGLAGNKFDAMDFIEKAHSRFQKIMFSKRKKLAQRILSGKSKYATEIELPQGKCSFRHTLWFTPPERLELDPSWKFIEYDDIAKSETIWVDSFLNHPAAADLPVARMICPDSRSVLFYKK